VSFLQHDFQAYFATVPLQEIHFEKAYCLQYTSQAVSVRNTLRVDTQNFSNNVATQMASRPIIRQILD